MVNANKMHYFETLKKEDRDEVIQKEVDSKTPFICWLKGKEKKAETFEPSHYEIASSTIYLEAKGGMLKSITGSSLKDKDVLVKIPSKDLIYFTTGPFKYDKESKKYYLQLKHDFYISQQRRDYRLNCNSFIKLQLKVDDEVFEVMDVSAGGASYSAGNDNLTRFEVGKEFKICRLRINRFQCDIPLVKVVKCWPIKDDKGEPSGDTAFAVSFSGLDKKTDEELCREINGEARADEIRRKV
ncbi:MAG: PilZ domain-containing protein [Halobacteriovoraceae bacterium]|jgi:hypothetical protein|nr:PilZ domain-containing protein [Halobacteriovoraceae bacterium]MBT5095952.1 PilZ domain-containing protein [Halobacteriovoraceae bacterium]